MGKFHQEKRGSQALHILNRSVEFQLCQWRLYLTKNAEVMIDCPIQNIKTALI
jgi:hypothetical protein